jgi:hypothetical protein
MKDIFKVKARSWFVVGGLLLLMSITSVGYVHAAGLTDVEKNWLTYMREEEKLARDVYLFLYDRWGSLIFDNISVREQTHMDRIKTLLERYRLDDPVVGNDLGVFDNPELQTLYNQMINGGSEFLIDALRVGVFIEVTDIADLTKGIAETNHKDIKTVYTNLRKGSQNHWDAFCSNLAKLGVTCEPYELPKP